MTQQKTPTVGKRQGQDEKVVVADGMNPTRNIVAAQGFSACVPCASCPYFRVVRFGSHKIRHQCGHSGEWLDSCGVHACTARQVVQEGGHHA